jgi:hypothetical protein
MKPPHPNDLPGNFVEVFAIVLDEGDAQEKLHIAPLSQHFLARLHKDGEPGAFWILDETGLHSLAMDEADLPIEILKDRNVTGENEIIRALYGSNIVAISE